MAGVEAWPPCNVTKSAMEARVRAGILRPLKDVEFPEWIVPSANDREPNPPPGYVVCFLSFLDWGFGILAGRLIRAILHYYEVELHNLKERIGVIEAREAWDKVAPLEERIGVFAQETEVQKAAAEGYKGEVARLEALLAEKDLALNQAQTDLAGALSQVARWHQSSAEHEKRAEGKTCVLYLGPLYTFELVFSDFLFLTLFFDRVRKEGG